MNKKLKALIGIVVVAILIGLIILIRTFAQKMSQVPDNEPSTIGNTAGNLYNNGLFVQNEQTVYFSNPYDSNHLYVMDVNQGNIRKLSVGSVSFLNYAGNHLYYYSSTSGEQSGLGYIRNGRGIYRTNTENGNTTVLARATTDSLILIGSRIYYTNFEEHPYNDTAIVSVNSVDINGQNIMTNIPDHVKLASSASGNLYYAGMDNDHFLHIYDTYTNHDSILLQENMYMPILSGDYIYYLDLRDDYHLKQYCFSDGSITTLVTERVDSYNLYGSVIYYQTCEPDSYALKRIRTDGSENETVADGVFENINITSEYVYFNEFNNPIPMYQTPTQGSVEVRTFDAALDAAMENME